MEPPTDGGKLTKAGSPGDSPLSEEAQKGMEYALGLIDRCAVRAGWRRRGSQAGGAVTAAARAALRHCSSHAADAHAPEQPPYLSQLGS